jgi:beta-glucosidase
LTFPSNESQGPGSTPATYPGKLDDAGMLSEVSYSEGSDVGYRYFEKYHQRPLFPFGFGLSYTSFHWTDLHVAPDADGAATVTATVVNSGHRQGSDTVQVYVVAPDVGDTRSPKQLKGVAKVDLPAQASRTIQIKLAADAFAGWSTADHAWRVAPGHWQVLIGRSSEDIVYRQTMPIRP